MDNTNLKSYAIVMYKVIKKVGGETAKTVHDKYTMYGITLHVHAAGHANMTILKIHPIY